jgi:hypothetical protein
MVFDSYLCTHTHIDEESCQIVGENTRKPLWQEEKTCPLGNNSNKILPSPKPLLSSPPHEKEPPMIPNLFEWA